MLSVAAAGGGSVVGLVLGGLALAIVLGSFATALYLAFQIASQTSAARHGLGLVRQHFDNADEVGRINDSTSRILRATRALHRVADE